MRTIVIFTFCFVLGFLFLVSCKENCPGFPSHLLDYFPYKQGDILSFNNQYIDTVSFQVLSIYVTKKHSISTCGACACQTPFVFFKTTQISNSNLRAMDMEISAEHQYAKPYIRFALSSGYFDGESMFTSLLYFYEETGKDPFDTKNSALFGETVIIENEIQQISKVTIVKGMGVTEFYDQKYDFQWKSINK
jgi:hypothetical protein